MPADALNHLVAQLSRDGGARDLLLHDPEQLGDALKLPPPWIGAMRSADRFFVNEKPILDGGVGAPVAPLSSVTAPPIPSFAARLQPLDSTLIASADTGTLLPGDEGGTYTYSDDWGANTATGSATSTSTAPERSPLPPVVAPGVSVQPGAPSLPAAPAIPAPPLFSGTPAPIFQPMPAVPSPPQRRVVGPTSCPAQPAPPPWICMPVCREIPAIAPPAPPTPAMTSMSAYPHELALCPCACDTAIVAMVAQVANTSITAMTALTAIARRVR